MALTSAAQTKPKPKTKPQAAQPSDVAVETTPVKNDVQPLSIPEDPRSKYELGVFLESVQDFTQAASLYRDAGKAGIPEAQNNLGYMHQKGIGIRRDFEEAVKWYRKAAEQNFPPGQNNLGVCYRDGTGIPRDIKKAARWFLKAAEQGLAEAQNNLGVRLYYGDGLPEDAKEAVQWFHKAAAQNLSDAIVNLGVAHVDGRGVPKNYIKAFVYFNTAAAYGDYYAAQAREKLKKEMTREQIADGQRLSIQTLSSIPARRAPN